MPSTALAALKLNFRTSETHKMKTLFAKSLLALSCCLSIMHGYAQTTENFNSRAGVATHQLKNHLQSSCWQFPDMDVNRTGWNAAIEGDGAMVSGQSSNSYQNTGIISPVLHIQNPVTISFQYKFNNQVNHRRWMLVLLTDADNNLVQRLDSIELTGASKDLIYQYNKTLPTPTGAYKVYLNYKGINGTIRIAIDALQISAQQKYTSGCNQAPIAQADSLIGTSARTAIGDVLTNDIDPEQEGMEVSLESASPDGEVSLQPNGKFTFTPKPDFKGTSTSFRYNVCDKGHSPRCGNGVVTINFPAAAVLPVTLVDFAAAYKNQQVFIRWRTSYEMNHDRFEIERSTNGRDFDRIGTIYGNGNRSIITDYQFQDPLNRVNTQKHDLYYRLRQIDKDGKQTLSKVLLVRLYENKSIQLVSVTPNPAINHIRVQVSLENDAMVSMRVLSTNGIEVYRKTTKGLAGANSFELEGSNQFAPGVYMLEIIINAQERMLMKLVKQ